MRARRGRTGEGVASVGSENALPPHVIELFQELGSVLEDARSRLEALLADAVPAQQTRTAPAEPTTGSH